MEIETTYQGTDVLKNELNIRDRLNWEYYARKITDENLDKLYFEPYEGEFNTECIKYFHEKIFEGFADKSWLREFRDVNIGKNGQWFCECHDEHGGFTRLEKECDRFFGILKKENYLADYSDNKEMFCSRLSSFFSELNYIHPFREGNGRTQREFWRQVADRAGYIIRWQDMDKQQFNEACINAAKGHLDELTNIFLNITEVKGLEKTLWHENRDKLEDIIRRKVYEYDPYFQESLSNRGEVYIKRGQKIENREEALNDVKILLSVAKMESILNNEKKPFFDRIDDVAEIIDNNWKLNRDSNRDYFWKLVSTFERFCPYAQDVITTTNYYQSLSDVFKELHLEFIDKGERRRLSFQEMQTHSFDRY